MGPLLRSTAEFFDFRLLALQSKWDDAGDVHIWTVDLIEKWRLALAGAQTSPGAWDQTYMHVEL